MSIFDGKEMKQFWKDYEYDINLEDSFYHSNTDYSYTQCYHHDYTMYNSEGVIVDTGLMIE